ncbi:MAG: type II toxin-antitoxin system prevent-host-death family antitoxin [Actinomycetota bacterium]|nr:type II toxin-antitoxin system prevent-host-death family antitoxin [Actinomycetota bacterium]
MNVGVRELKNSLSRYLKRVKEGETIVVTERGRPVARILPADVPDRIAKLMTEGRVSWSGRAFRPPESLIRPRPGRPFSDYVAEDRR